MRFSVRFFNTRIQCCTYEFAARSVVLLRLSLMKLEARPSMLLNLMRALEVIPELPVLNVTVYFPEHVKQILIHRNLQDT